jgi:MFS family permease
MALFGSTFLPISWSVPSEIIPPDEAVYANVPGWIATSITISVPPIIQGIMPDQNTYPVFFFFGLYGIFGCIILYKYLIETKGKTYDEIIKEI